MDTASREVLGKATARLAHEIKNSLTGIVGALEVLQDRLSPTTEIDDIMERVGAEVQRIEGSVKELSAFAEPKAAVLKRTNLHDVIDQSIEKAPLSTSTRVARQYQDGMPPIAVDEKLLGQALHRILLNAEEAMPDGGILTVSTTWDQDRALISIRDTGSGVPAEELERIFEPFFTRKMRGLGLGLAISRTLVDAHGGSLSVVSPAEGGYRVRDRAPPLVVALNHRRGHLRTDIVSPHPARSPSGRFCVRAVREGKASPRACPPRPGSARTCTPCRP